MRGSKLSTGKSFKIARMGLRSYIELIFELANRVSFHQARRSIHGTNRCCLVVLIRIRKSIILKSASALI
jgi:hypothetical protein